MSGLRVKNTTIILPHKNEHVKPFADVLLKKLSSIGVKAEVVELAQNVKKGWAIKKILADMYPHLSKEDYSIEFTKLIQTLDFYYRIDANEAALKKHPSGVVLEIHAYPTSSMVPGNENYSFEESARLSENAYNLIPGTQILRFSLIDALFGSQWLTLQPKPKKLTNLPKDRENRNRELKILSKQREKYKKETNMLSFLSSLIDFDFKEAHAKVISGREALKSLGNQLQAIEVPGIKAPLPSDHHMFQYYYDISASSGAIISKDPPEHIDFHRAIVVGDLSFTSQDVNAVLNFYFKRA